MKSTANSKRVIGFALTTALAGALLAGCTTAGAPSASLSASQAESALALGKHDKAVAHAEAAVLAEPRNAAYRAMLGNAYLDAGRFASAATSFDDAMQLGDATPRNALSLSLALSAQGKYREAAKLLADWEGEIAVADLGLALAIAGQPERGIHLMSNAIRGGDNTAKMRQNLAYSYALGGRWREARLMAAEDIPENKLGDRMEEWARMASPEAWQTRVAALLDVPAGMADAGQPIQLALSNHPVNPVDAVATAVAVAETAELPPVAVAAAPATELPPLETAPAQVERFEAPAAVARYEQPTSIPASDFAAAFAGAAPPREAPAAVAQAAPRVTPAVAAAHPARRVAAAQPAAARSAPSADGTHLVQLGSFASESGARRAWGIYLKKYPELSGHEMVISEAVVRGKRYWRVSAAGFGRSTSNAMCGRVKAGGQGCIAWAEGRPLPGAVDTGVRLARR